MNYEITVDIFEEENKKHNGSDNKMNNVSSSIPKDKEVVKKQLGNISLYNADSFDFLRRTPSNSISSAVIDPPYGIGFMGHEWDNFSPTTIQSKSEDYSGNNNIGSTRSASFHAGTYDTTYAGSVRFQKWCRNWAIELWRVLKPGAHVLVFCSPRRVHRLSCGLEDAGFHIKDMLMWVFGSGFPKNHNISKAIIKKAGNQVTEQANDTILLMAFLGNIPITAAKALIDINDRNSFDCYDFHVVAVFICTSFQTHREEERP